MKTTSLVLGNSYVLWTSNVYVPAGSATLVLVEDPTVSTDCDVDVV